jgi:peptidyl-prolyl cis-trans isomerase B (cyclophilin B)
MAPATLTTTPRATSPSQASSSRRRRVIATALGLLASAAVLAGCASPDSGGSGSTGDTGSNGATSDSGSAYSLPDPSTAEDRDWTASLDLNGSPLQLTLDGAAAPQAVASFVSLANAGFFDDTECHRLTTAGIFVLQCGDPTATGTGGPGYNFGPIENAPEDGVYPAGTVAMARVGGDAESNGSQFFLVYADSTIPSDAAGGYTVFGTVDEGLDVVQAIAAEGLVDGSSAPAAGALLTNVTAQ